MATNPRISVIIPTFNCEEYIIDTLESVYNQTITPYEVCIVDDGSEDNTMALLQSYIRSHPDLAWKLEVQENQGAGAARNRAINNATGEWIAFLDGDDLWDRRKIERVIFEIDRGHCEINFVAHNEYHLLGDKRISVNLFERYDPLIPLRIQLVGNNIFSTSAVVLKRLLVLDVGGFDERYRSAQDYELWLRLAKKINLLIISDYLGSYRIRKGSISQLSKFGRIQNIFNIYWSPGLKLSALEWCAGIVNLLKMTVVEFRSCLNEKNY